MYRKIDICVITIFFIMVILCIAFVATSTRNNVYERPAEVIEIYNNVVTIKDNYGNFWAFTGSDGYRVGDKIICKMNTGTYPTIYDDKIVEIIKKSS